MEQRVALHESGTKTNFTFQFINPFCNASLTKTYMLTMLHSPQYTCVSEVLQRTILDYIL